MKTEGTHDAGKGDGPQDDDALWRLLDRQVPPVPPSPYFARRVLREVALLEERRQRGWPARLGGWFPLVPRRVARWSGALALGAVCLAVGLNLDRPADSSRPVASATPALTAAPSAGPAAAPASDEVAVQDVEIIADLDSLLQHEESRLWTDDTARF